MNELAQNVIVFSGFKQIKCLALKKKTYKLINNFLIDHKNFYYTQACSEL